MTANHSPSPLVLLAPPAPLFGTPTVSASTAYRRLPWETTRDWMSALSDGKEGMTSITALRQTHADTASHILPHKCTAMYKLAHKQTQSHSRIHQDISKNQ